MRDVDTGSAEQAFYANIRHEHQGRLSFILWNCE